MKDDNDKKLAFVQAMTQHGLKHFASGGGIQQPVPTTSGQAISADPANVNGDLGNGLSSAGSFIGNATKGLASDLTVQNGYQAGLAPVDTTNYQNLIAQSGNQALSGYGNFQNIQGQQQALANTLGQQAQGQGPNVAQNQLNATTGQNTVNQAALMASQRGAGGNVGLMARNAGQQGATNQQQAVGQSATLRAQQQLAAQQALAQQQGIMGQQNIGEQGANNQLFGAGASAQNAQNNSMISNYGMAQGINSQIAQANANASNKTTAGILGEHQTNFHLFYQKVVLLEETVFQNILNT